MKDTIVALGEFRESFWQVQKTEAVRISVTLEGDTLLSDLRFTWKTIFSNWS